MKLYKLIAICWWPTIAILGVTVANYLGYFNK